MEIELPYDFEGRATSPLGIEMQMPLWIGTNWDNLWLLPIEPIVSVSMPIVVNRSPVAKNNGYGTIKERWAMDDFSIKISGIFINIENEDEFPKEDVGKLRGLCVEHKRSLYVHCKLFDALGINSMAIGSLSFPATEGIFQQDYVIEGWSDTEYNLLVG